MITFIKKNTLKGNRRLEIIASLLKKKLFLKPGGSRANQGWFLGSKLIYYNILQVKIVLITHFSKKIVLIQY